MKRLNVSLLAILLPSVAHATQKCPVGTTPGHARGGAFLLVCALGAAIAMLSAFWLVRRNKLGPRAAWALGGLSFLLVVAGAVLYLRSVMTCYPLAGLVP